MTPVRRLAMVGLLAAAACPALAKGGDGWAAYDAKRYADAVRLWAPEAQEGDTQAAFGLGLAYDLGQGVTADGTEACAWYRRAGSAGHAVAAFSAAVLYDGGRCGPRRADLAALWYARAAAGGHGRAQFNIAQLYAVGDGVPRNPDLAAAWFRAAAASGIPATAGRDRPPPRALATQPPLAASPAALDDAPPAAGGPAVLVWTAPPQPGRVRFFVELAALLPDGPREVVARYVDESAIQVRLPPGERNLAWRVLTVSTDAQRYTASPWQRLEARP